MAKLISSYSVATAYFNLLSYGIDMPMAAIKEELQKPDSIYHDLLSMSCAQQANGIVLEHVRDYSAFITKKYVNYTMDIEKNIKPQVEDEDGTPIQPQGQRTRDELAECRKALEVLEKSVETTVTQHKTLLRQTKDSIIHLVNEQTSSPTKEQIDITMQPYVLPIKQVKQELLDERTQFKDLIVRVSTLMKSLPDYTIDPIQELEERELLPHSGMAGG